MRGRRKEPKSAAVFPKFCAVSTRKKLGTKRKFMVPIRFRPLIAKMARAGRADQFLKAQAS